MNLGSFVAKAYRAPKDSLDYQKGSGLVEAYDLFHKSFPELGKEESTEVTESLKGDLKEQVSDAIQKSKSRSQRDESPQP